MSDSMERNKNENLRAREIEEEEMKRELTGIGIYDPGYTYVDMKQIIGFLNESSNSSKGASPSKNTPNKTQNTDDDCASETAADTNPSQELVVQERTPTYSYRQSSRISSTTYELISNRYPSSPDSPIFEVQNSVCSKSKSSNNDEIVENQHESINSTQNINHHPSKLGNVLREYQNMTQLKKSEQGEHNQKLDRWRLNPLDVCINENDVPLQQPHRPSAQERMPFQSCKEAYRSEKGDEIMQAVSLHLKKMADLWCSRHSFTNSKFQWGSPIQVGTANGSLDKKPLTDLKTEQIKTEYTCEDNQVRRSKRKASSLITNLKEQSSTEDEDDRCNIGCAKKKKTYPDKEWNNTDHLNEHAEISSNKTSTNLVAHGEYSIDDDDSNEDPRSSRLMKRIDKENDCLNKSPELVTYPRRIVPPTPKARPSISKQKKNNTTPKSSRKVKRNNGNKKVEQMKNRKKDNTLTDEDIRQKLEEDSDEEDAAITVKEDINLRPLPIPKEIDAKLRKKQLSNRKTNKDMETISKKEEIERQKVRKERIEERKEGDNNNVDVGLLSDEEKSAGMKPAFDIQNGNKHDDVSTSMNYIHCPICNRLFPKDQIEDHASDCDQFDINNEDDNDVNQLACNICKNYKTNNKIKYNEHVDKCIHDMTARVIPHDSENIDIDTMPTSSFHSYTPISEQKDSEIDYTRQFSPHKTRTISSKKRKH